MELDHTLKDERNPYLREDVKQANREEDASAEGVCEAKTVVVVLGAGTRNE